MVVKIDTPLGILTVSGKKSVLNSLCMLLGEARDYNFGIGCTGTAELIHSEANQIFQALSETGYYDSVRDCHERISNL